MVSDFLGTGKNEQTVRLRNSPAVISLLIGASFAVELIPEPCTFFFLNAYC
jgi:hypothetical protein